MLQVALKCADVGHLAAPWAVHNRSVPCRGAALESEGLSYIFLVASMGLPLNLPKSAAPVVLLLHDTPDLLLPL